MALKPRARGSSTATPQLRSVQISKSLAWLLRHGATKERIAITPSGYVNVADVLAWHKLRALAVTFDEIVACVQDNEKQRFSLRWEGDAGGEEGSAELESPNQIALARIRAAAGEAKGQSESESESEVDVEAEVAAAAVVAVQAREYSIRAVQGHSLKSVDAGALLTRVTLEDVPAVCVHGTFFAAWPLILKTGGLKAMTRNHVHFATGPAMSDVLVSGGEAMAVNGDRAFKLKEAMEKSEVVSGMRGDAQVLIYVDVKRSIEEGKMEWGRSENGVMLTEGVVVGESTPLSELDETTMMLQETKVEGQKPSNHTKGHSRRSSQAVKAKPPQKLVPMEYWDTVVGIGIGILWQRGKGVVQEVPAETMMNAKGKIPARGMNGKPQKGKGSEKPTVRVERDNIYGFD